MIIAYMYMCKLSNEYCLNCFINGGENQMRIKANLSNFATNYSAVYRMY